MSTKALSLPPLVCCSMPNFIRTPFDREAAKAEPLPAHEPGAVTGIIAIPASVWRAMLRGFVGNCPRCGQAKLFGSFLKPIRLCPSCGQDWTHQRADDFPAYVSILMTGHLMVPLIITLTQHAELSIVALLAIVVPLALVVLIGLLQPAKGAIIALQWWFGMHGFKQERPVRVGVGVGTEP